MASLARNRPSHARGSFRRCAVKAWREALLTPVGRERPRTRNAWCASFREHQGCCEVVEVQTCPWPLGLSAGAGARPRPSNFVIRGAEELPTLNPCPDRK